MDDALLERYKAQIAEADALFDDNGDGTDEACAMIAQAMKDADDEYAASDRTPADKKRLGIKLKSLYSAYQHHHCGRPHIIPPPGLAQG